MNAIRVRLALLGNYFTLSLIQFGLLLPITPDALAFMFCVVFITDAHEIEHSLYRSQKQSLGSINPLSSTQLDSRPNAVFCYITSPQS